MQATESCAHTIETVCGGVRLCCARGRSDAVRNRASSSLSRDCRCTRACQASKPCAHTNETVCGGVRLCCARGRSDAVRNRASSSLSRDCRGGVFFSAVQTRVQSQQFDHVAVVACVVCVKQDAATAGLLRSPRRSSASVVLQFRSPGNTNHM